MSRWKKYAVSIADVLYPHHTPIARNVPNLQTQRFCIAPNRGIPELPRLFAVEQHITALINL